MNELKHTVATLASTVLITVTAYLIGRAVINWYDERKTPRSPPPPLPAGVILDEEEMNIARDRITLANSIDVSLDDIGGLTLIKRGLR